MSARPVIGSLVGPVRAAPLFSPGNVEALKWVGLLAMLYEHWHTLVVGDPTGQAFQFGRVAFPLFAIAFGLGVSAAPSKQCFRAAWRLGVVALGAQLGVALTRHSGLLSVLFTFFAAAAWVAADQESAGKQVAIRVCAVALAFFSEFWWPGLFLIVALVRVLSGRGAWWWAVVLAVSWCAMSGFDRTGMSFVALGVCALVCAFDIQVRRFPSLFLWLYALQFPVFSFARWVM